MNILRKGNTLCVFSHVIGLKRIEEEHPHTNRNASKDKLKIEEALMKYISAEVQADAQAKFNALIFQPKYVTLLEAQLFEAQFYKMREDAAINQFFEGGGAPKSFTTAFDAIKRYKPSTPKQFNPKKREYNQYEKYTEEICKQTQELKLLEKLYKKFGNKEVHNFEQDNEYIQYLKLYEKHQELFHFEKEPSE
ncbi:26220_t:CDS:2, partial [Racocetra persica]